jgi:AcrR family transcriptional regulator
VATTLSRRDRVRAATVTEIKDTARRILVAEGPDGLSLRAIAREMGMTAPALYRYFPSREDLIGALIADLYDELTAAISTAARTAGDAAGGVGGGAADATARGAAGKDSLGAGGDPARRTAGDAAGGVGGGAADATARGAAGNDSPGAGADPARRTAGDAAGAVGGGQGGVAGETGGGDPRAGITAASRAFRAWALAHPREFGLLFGSPIPGIDAHSDDSPAGLASERFGQVFGDLVARIYLAGPFPVPAEDEMDPELRRQLRDWCSALPVELPVGAGQVFLSCWIRLYGMVALEVFGHVQFALPDAEPLFEAELRDLAVKLGFGQSTAP